MRPWVSIAGWLMAVLALLAGGAGLGAHWQSKRDAAALFAAKVDAGICQVNAIAQQGALDTLAAQAAERLRQVRALQAATANALAQADAERQRADQQTLARQRALEKVTHETSDCQSLAALPVCPAVARRLWGEVSHPDTTASY